MPNSTGRTSLHHTGQASWLLSMHDVIVVLHSRHEDSQGSSYSSICPALNMLTTLERVYAAQKN
jgi:hypothetical protein